MALEYGQTEELVNTHYAPVAALLAHYQAHEVLAPLETVVLEMKTIAYTPGNKLGQAFISILTGCEYVSMINTRLGTERSLAQVYSIDRFAHQSTISDTLDALSQMNLADIDRAVTQISRRCSRTRRHDWRGFLWIDFDLSGLPCGRQAEAAKRGFFSGKKTSPGGSWHGQVPSTTMKPSAQTSLQAISPQPRVWNRSCSASKLHLS